MMIPAGALADCDAREPAEWFRWRRGRSAHLAARSSAPGHCSLGCLRCCRHRVAKHDQERGV